MRKKLSLLLSCMLLLGTCMGAVSVSAENETAEDPAGTLLYEFETLAQENEVTDHIVTNENSSGGKYWGSTGYGGPESEDTLTFNFKFQVTTAGIYDFYYAFSDENTCKDNISIATFTVNGALLGDNKNNATLIKDLSVYTEQDGKSVRTYPWNYCAMELFQGAKAKLNVGENTLTVAIKRSGGNQKLFKYFADYIKFVPAQALSVGNEKVNIEAESLTTVNVNANQNASGGNVVGTSWATVPNNLYTVIDVAESGYYDFTMRANKVPHDWISTLNLTIDDTLVMDNKTNRNGAKNYDSATDVHAQYEQTELLKFFSDNSAPMHEFTKNYVWLQKGRHTLDVAQVVTNDNARKYCIDNITLTPSEDSVVKNTDGTYTVKALYGTDVSGAAIIALYNGDTFVGVTGATLENQAINTTVTLPENQTADTLKVFVWDGFTNCIPQTEAKVFDLTE